MKIILDMPAADYHAHPAVSKSLLDRVAKSPAHARAYLDGQRTEPTAAMQFGTALHCAVLEPGRFANEFAIFEGDRRTKAGKEAYEILIQSGATPISRADYDAISAMAESIRNHPEAGKYLLSGVAEASVFWNDALSGVECKCRPDWWDREAGLVLDLKTTEDASSQAFARSIATYRYHVQAAHYKAGTKASRFVMVAIEKKPPYAVALYEIDADGLEKGYSLRLRDLEKYASCAEFKVWPGYPAAVQTISLPAYAMMQEDK